MFTESKESYPIAQCTNFTGITEERPQHPGLEFKMSRYNGISLRRPRNTAQKQPKTRSTSIKEFHQYLRRAATDKATELRGVQEGIVGSILFQHKGSYLNTAEKGETSVWTRVTAEGNDKRQSTVQLTIIICQWKTSHHTIVDLQGHREKNTRQREEAA